MIARLVAAFFLLLSLSLPACRWAPGRASPGDPPPADLVLRNGAVYTVDAARSWATAIAVRGGRIVYIGTDSLPPGVVGPRTETVDHAGRMVLPGFQDAHAHPVTSGIDLGERDLNAAKTAAEAADSIRAYAAAHPDLPWIRGAGWQLPLFPDGNPSKALLDRLVPDRPAMLWAADGHSAWLNSRALALAKIARDTPDPPNGRIERDPRTGEPSGTLRESASNLVERVLPPWSPAEQADGLARAQRLASSFLDPLVAELDRDGFQVHIHAIGDRAIRMALDALAHARAVNGVRDSRHAIAHLELIDPTDIPRFRELGVVANFQPLWANGDEYLTKMTEPALGPARSRWLYPIASVVRSGAVVFRRDGLPGAPRPSH